MKLEAISQKIKNYNGNRLIIGELNDGNEITLLIDSPELRDDELKDYATGLIYNERNFKSFENFSDHYVYRETKNHDARDPGKYLEGGQNLRR